MTIQIYWLTPHDQRDYRPDHLTEAERLAEVELLTAVDLAERRWLSALGTDDIPSDPTPIQAAALWAESGAGEQALAQVPGGWLFAALGWRPLRFTPDARQCHVEGLPMPLEVVGMGGGSGPLDYGVVVVSWHNEAQATLDVRFIPVPPEFSDDGEDDDEWSTWSEDRFSADAPA